MDKVLKFPNGDGVDGFKCDGTDPYVMEYLLEGGALGYNDVKYTSYTQYAKYYYEDFFDYTRKVRGNAGLIMSRPVDCQLDKDSSVCWGFSSKRVMASGWVGDDDGTFQGLRGCARKVIYSAWDGYSSFGCDIGGYRDMPEQTADEHKRIFIRWTQFGALSPLMENGGGGEHRPWMFDEETTDIYRQFAELHVKLAPYLLTTGSAAMDAGISAVHPVAVRDESGRDRSHRWYPEPSTFTYMLGSDILVFPILHDSSLPLEKKLTAMDLNFPGTSSDTWLDWFAPTDAKKAFIGGSESKNLYSLSDYPVFVRQGALLALSEQTSSESIISGSEGTIFTLFASESYFANARAASAASPLVASAEMREPIELGVGLAASTMLVKVSDGSDALMLTASISAHSTARAGFEFVGVTRPTDVKLAQGAICEEYSYDATKQSLVVMCSNLASGLTLQVNF